MKVCADSQQNNFLKTPFCTSKRAILLNFVKFGKKNQYFRHKGGFSHFVSFSSKRNPLEPTGHPSHLLIGEENISENRQSCCTL